MPQKKAANTPPVAVDVPPQDALAPEGLPNPASVVGEQTFISPTGRKYTILKTTEVDASDKRVGKRKKRKGKAEKRP